MAKKQRKPSPQNTSVEPMKLIAKTANQQAAIDSIERQEDTVMLGCAGTGKTFVALSAAMEHLLDGNFEKIVIVRSTVPSRDQGFLPGTIDEKQAVYEQPYKGIITEVTGRGDAYGILKSKGMLQFESTSYLRGTTMSRCIVVIDEAQNMTWEEFNTVYTRLGEDSMCIVCGDFAQTDHATGKSGFGRVIRIFEHLGINVVWMSEDDIVRSKRVKEWIIASNRISS